MQTQANKMSQNMFLVIDARKCDGYELKTRSSFAFCLVSDLVRWWLADCFNGTLYWHLIHLSCFFALFESNACIVNVFSLDDTARKFEALETFFIAKKERKKKTPIDLSSWTHTQFNSFSRKITFTFFYACSLLMEYNTEIIICFHCKCNAFSSILRR